MAGRRLDLNGRADRPQRQRRFRRTLLGPLLGLMILMVGVAYFYRLDGVGGVAAPEGTEAIEAYVVNNGFHTDLVLPRSVLEATPGVLGQAVASDPGQGAWVYMGWGDARFFVEEGPIMLRWRDGLRALFGRNNPSVLMVRTEGSPQTYYAENQRISLPLSATAYGQLVARVDEGLQTDQAGRAVLAEVRARDGTRFYAHRERFWIGHLCNHWTLGALQAAGLTVWPWRPMTSAEVMRQARRAA